MTILEVGHYVHWRVVNDTREMRAIEGQAQLNLPISA
jgi:hypothetical protein